MAQCTCIGTQWPPNVPLSVKLSVSMSSFAVNITRRPDGTVNRCLMSFFDQKTSPSKKPINGVISTDITIDEYRNLFIRIYTPTSATNGSGLPVIFFFHGGGFAYSQANSKSYDDFCYRLSSELSVIIISGNYRLSPEHRYPSQYEDGFDVLKFINKTEIEGFSSKADLTKCFIAGDSAGGNLAHHVAVKAGEYQFYNLKFIGIILMQPFFGGEERTDSELRLLRAPSLNLELTDWFWKSFLPEGANRDHPAANVSGPNSADISGIELPPILMFVGGYDPLQDWQQRYYIWLNQMGKNVQVVKYPDAFHTFYIFPQLHESDLFIDKVRDFVEKQTVVS